MPTKKRKEELFPVCVVWSSTTAVGVLGTTDKLYMAHNVEALTACIKVVVDNG